MTDLQWFAFVIMPVIAVAFGAILAWLGHRFIP